MSIDVFNVFTTFDGLAIVALLNFGGPILAKRRGWFPRMRWPTLPARILYTAALAVVWLGSAFGLLHEPVPLIASFAIALAYIFAPTDDDDHRKPRRRLRTAWKRATKYLAHGLEPAHDLH
jgi:hypothetical protein